MFAEPTLSNEVSQCQDATRVTKLINYRAVGAEEPEDTDLVAEVLV